MTTGSSRTFKSFTYTLLAGVFPCTYVRCYTQNPFRCRYGVLYDRARVHAIIRSKLAEEKLKGFISCERTRVTTIMITNTAEAV